jgi:hypothetical protein
MHQLIDIKLKLKAGKEVFDDEIDFLLNPSFQPHADRHFTSIYIAQLAVKFLTENGEKHILDIGSGTGKFCLIGGMISTSKFTGIEYRSDFVEEANKFISAAELTHVQFINANMLDCSFEDYNAFYMFNPFLEHVDPTATMGSGVQPSETLYHKYNQHVVNQLNNCAEGTRLVTYYINENLIPKSFVIRKKMIQQTLLFWEKEC